MSVTIPEGQELVIAILRVLAGREGGIARHEIVEAVLTDAGSGPDDTPTVDLRRTAVRRIRRMLRRLEQEGAVQRIERGVYVITERGRKILADKGSEPGIPDDPEEVIDRAAAQLRRDLASELLARLRTLPPAAFEQLVVELLLAMGYGARGRGVRVGRSGDGGIDGMVDEDALGLDTVYLQAKRYGEGNSVGREQLQAFAGALLGHGVHKGVFVTTGRFTREARAWAESQRDRRIVLIDGERLAGLMIDHGVGVRTQRTIEIRSLDEDWFEGLGG